MDCIDRRELLRLHWLSRPDVAGSQRSFCSPLAVAVEDGGDSVSGGEEDEGGLSWDEFSCSWWGNSLKSGAC